MTAFPQNEDLAGAEETLRQLAKLTPPSGLETRIHNRLAAADVTSERRNFWALWAPARRLQFAAAALVGIAMGVSTWSVYRSHPYSPIQPPTQSQAPLIQHPVQPKADSSSGFKTAGAERRPSSVAPIKIHPAPKKKPSASHAARKSPKQAEDTNAAPAP